jgi:putative addiction module killer protein
MSLIRYNFNSEETPYRIEIYKTAVGRSPFDDWLRSLRDEKTENIVGMRVARIRSGTFGDRKAIGEGVWELRIDFGPGFRIYYAMIGARIVLLLTAGDKSGQRKDIKNAISYWREFKRR